MDRGDSYRTIYLNEKLFEISSTQYDQLSSFVNKTTFGDPNYDSDPLLSAKIYTSFIGGIGIERAKENIDDQRYWIGSLETRRPYQLSLCPNTHEVGHSAAIYPLGDYSNGVYFGTATTLHSYSESTGLSASLGALSAAPVYRGWDFQGKLYIPQSTGYQTWNGTTVAAQNTAVKAICFAEWDDKLYALCSDFKLQRTLDGSTWTSFNLNTSMQLRRLVLYVDAAGNDTLYIITTRGIYAWDEENQRVVTTRMGHLPSHPDNGYGAAMWRQGEDLFVSAGLDVYRWTISGVAPFSGPSADQGLPAEYRGKIVDLCPEHSAMYALIQGVSGPTTPFTPTTLVDVGQNTEGEFDVNQGDTTNIVLCWDGHGWHPAAVPTGSGAPTWLIVSGANNNYRIWWSVGNSLYTQQLGRPILNPRERIRANLGDFALHGEMTFSKFDGNMFMYDKLASHVEVYFDYFDPSLHYFSVEHRSESDEWELVNIDYESQRTIVIPFHPVTLDDGTTFGYGQRFRWLQFRITMNSETNLSSPVLEAFSVKFIRIPNKQIGLTVNIEFKSEMHGNRPVDEAIRDLEAMTTIPQFVRLQLGSLPDTSYRVYLTRSAGAGLSGDDPRGYRSLTLAQISLPGYEGRQS